MIWILAKNHAVATDLALDAKLKRDQWQWLARPEFLVGRHDGNAVMMTGWRSGFSIPEADTIEMMLNTRDITVWTELDLLNGKVPL